MRSINQLQNSVKATKRKSEIILSKVLIINSEKESKIMNRLLSFVLNLIYLKLKIMKVIVRMIVRKSHLIYRLLYQRLF